MECLDTLITVIMESLEQCMECLEVLIIMPPATTEMKAAITMMKMTKDTEVAGDMHMEEHILMLTVVMVDILTTATPINMEDLLVVTVVAVVKVKMLLLFVANSKMK